MRNHYLEILLLFSTITAWAGTTTWNTVPTPLPTTVPDWTLQGTEVYGSRTGYYSGAPQLIDMDSTHGTQPSPLVVRAKIETTADLPPKHPQVLKFFVHNIRSGAVTQLGPTVQYQSTQAECNCYDNPAFVDLDAPCTRPDGPFVDIVASEAVDGNGHGTYYVIVAWVKDLEEIGYSVELDARLYKVTDDLTYTLLRTYTINNDDAWYCNPQHCFHYAHWTGGAVAVQKHGSEDRVFVLLAYQSDLTFGSKWLADTYSPTYNNSSTYSSTICNLGLGVSGLPAAG